MTTALWLGRSRLEGNENVLVLSGADIVGVVLFLDKFHVILD
jgi:hypothetical protein